MNIFRSLFLITFLFLFTATGVFAQDDGMHDMLHASPPDEIYKQALDNWHEGHYPQALHAFRHLLEGKESDRFFERIALKTGELYRVSEVSEDGSDIRFGAQGRYAIYEGSEDETDYTFLYDLQAAEPVARVQGHTLQMLGDGSLLFRRLDENEEVLKAREERAQQVARAQEEGDYDLWRQANRQYEAVEIANTRLMHAEAPGEEARDITPEDFIVGEVVPSADGKTLYMIAVKGDEHHSNVYAYRPGEGSVEALADGHGYFGGLHLLGEGTQLAYRYEEYNSLLPQYTVNAEISGNTAVLDMETGRTHIIQGELVDARRGAYGLLIRRELQDQTQLAFVNTRDRYAESIIITTSYPVTDATLSPGGTRVAYALRAQDDYEIYAHHTDGSGERMRVSRELQHDRFPAFLDEDRLVAAKGEGRHRRSFLYNLQNGQVQKLFHNNTLRTIAPEYEWAVHPDGSKLLIVSERDGDTISPERGVYLLDLSEQITREELMTRINRNMEHEEALRAKGERLYEQIAEQVAQVTGEISIRRVYKYEEDLYDFDSKYITQPGNDMAAEYIYEQFQDFGYQPQYQWFSPEGRDVYGGKTANVIARLEGTTNPELVYVISSHYDSSERGPGADDNTSGTAALLEAARVLADNPMPATIIFAAFTGEEAGLLGSREFVRRAQESGMQLVGALNNDMVGFANNARLDNTIRYSNPGIRDIQHNAARMFSEMVTYDALYYKFTDAHAYYEAYGDIVGGIGSYPVLGSPFYHQWNDNLETVNHQLVAEVSKTTVATLMLLASSPSRLAGLRVETLQSADQHRVSWTPSSESNIDHYLVEFEGRTGGVQQATVNAPEITLDDLAPGSEVRVKAVNARGMEGWDWARVGVSPQ